MSRIAPVILAVTFSIFAAPAPLLAQEGEAAPTNEGQDPQPEQMELPITVQTGKVTIGNHATIDLPEGFGYLQSQDAQFVVEKVWGNPPDPAVLGLVIPSTSKDPMEWDYGIITSFEDDGYVKDADAAETDYDDLLEQMQADARAANKRRKQMGYDTIDILGWAERPHYDSAEKKLYWAKTLQFGDEEGTTLNYDVRILGRHGYLVLQAVGSSEQLRQVADGSKQVLAKTQFVDGKRYEDFDSSLDKVAAYGIGGLIAGKVLLKGGLLKVLIKPLLVVGGIVLVALAKLFGGKKKQRVEPA